MGKKERKKGEKREHKKLQSNETFFNIYKYYICDFIILYFFFLYIYIHLFFPLHMEKVSLTEDQQDQQQQQQQQPPPSLQGSENTVASTDTPSKTSGEKPPKERRHHHRRHHHDLRSKTSEKVKAEKARIEKSKNIFEEEFSQIDNDDDYDDFFGTGHLSGVFIPRDTNAKALEKQGSLRFEMVSFQKIPSLRILKSTSTKVTSSMTSSLSTSPTLCEGEGEGEGEDENDSEDELCEYNPVKTSEYLTDYCRIVKKQLPFMSKDYILHIVFDMRSHRTLLVIKQGSVIGGICYRTFRAQGFIEIVFCVVDAQERARGFGTQMMNHLKEYMKKEEIYEFLTCADNSATDYFAKLGFTANITLPQNRYIDYIKLYDNSTLMQCSLSKLVPSYLELPEMFQRQRAAVLSRLPPLKMVHPLLGDLTKRRVIRRDDPSFPPLPEKRIHSEEEETFPVKLRKLIQRLKNAPSAWPFLKPVDEKLYPSYRKIVQVPVDLSLVEQRVYGGEYLSIADFIGDIQLMLQNCRSFNPEGNIYHETSIKFEKEFKHELRLLSF